MIRKVETSGDRVYFYFAANDIGGATGIAVQVPGGYAYYDQLNIHPVTGPALAGCYDSPRDAAVQGALSLQRSFRARRFEPFSEDEAQRYADALLHAPYDPAPPPSCHYCGQGVDPRRAVVGLFGEYQCKQCS